MNGNVVGLHRSARHGFSKQAERQLTLLAGLGVEGDAHCGATVKHRSRVAQDPTQPNLRQVHLLQVELLQELAHQGFHIAPGELGENVTTSGIDLLALPRGSRLHLGSAVLEITGLRNPCAQIEAFKTGLLAAVLGRDEQGQLIRKAGVMAIVLTGGEVAIGDWIELKFPPLPHHALERV